MGREHPLTSLPFGLRGALLRVCNLGRLLTLTTRNLWSRQGPAFSLNCPASLVMEFWSAGNESPIALLWCGWVGGEGLLIYLLSQCPVIWIKLWIKFVHEQETKNVWKQIRIFFSFFSLFIFISWRLITLQYCSGFCHTLTWLSHGFTCIPHLDPPSRKFFISIAIYTFYKL